MSLYTQLTALIPIIFSYLPHILFTVILLYVINFYISYINRENPLPGPIPLPMIGNIHQMWRDAPKFYTEMHERYGDVFEFYLINKRIIMLSRVDLAEKMLTQSVKSNYFIRITSTSQGWEELGLTKGLAGTKERHLWLLYRKVFKQCITSTKYMKETVHATQKLFSEVEEYWKELGDSASLEFTKWLHHLSVDTQVRILTGQQTYALSTYFNSLLPPHLKKSLPQSSIQSYSKFTSHLVSFVEVLKYFAVVPPFFRHYVPGFRQTAERMKRENDTNMIKSSEFERQLTEEETAQLLVETFLAGIDTTTNALCFTIYYICKYPAVKAHLLSEIDATLSSEGHSLSYDSIVTLFPYTSAVMKEAARVLPVVPIVLIIASEDDEIAGHKWRAGTAFGINHIGIHKHTAYWKDPETFRPERFLEDEINPKTFLPFGGTFEVELCEPDKEIEYAHHMATQCSGLK
ncbi:223_t:CDS:2, partial [Paraglomus occultum]